MFILFDIQTNFSWQLFVISKQLKSRSFRDVYVFHVWATFTHAYIHSMFGTLYMCFVLHVELTSLQCYIEYTREWLCQSFHEFAHCPLYLFNNVDYNIVTSPVMYGLFRTAPNSVCNKHVRFCRRICFVRPVICMGTIDWSTAMWRNLQ